MELEKFISKFLEDNKDNEEFLNIVRADLMDGMTEDEHQKEDESSGDTTSFTDVPDYDVVNNPIFRQYTPPFTHGIYYTPWYDDKADYNTNAKSYYDYLARFNYAFKELVKRKNLPLQRQVEVKDTQTIDLTREGNWLTNVFKDDELNIITLIAELKVSKKDYEYQLEIHNKMFYYRLANAIKILEDGIYSPDYTNVLNDLVNELDKIWDEIDQINAHIKNLGDRITALENIVNQLKSDMEKIKKALQKIVDNLYQGGAINNNNLDTFEFNSGQTIAYGNINHFGGDSPQDFFIRTKPTFQKFDTWLGGEDI